MMLLFVGSKAIALIVRAGSVRPGSSSVQVLPPSRVSQIPRLPVPYAYVPHVVSAGAKATAAIAMLVVAPGEPFCDQDGVVELKKSSVRYSRLVPARKTSSL